MACDGCLIFFKQIFLGYACIDVVPWQRGLCRIFRTAYPAACMPVISCLLPFVEIKVVCPGSSLQPRDQAVSISGERCSSHGQILPQAGHLLTVAFILNAAF